MKSLFFYFLIPASCFLLTALCVLFSAFLFPLSAQTSLEIKGIVTDSVTLKTLGYITISLTDEKNEPVKTGLTKEDGSFLFNAIQPGKYMLAVVAMGYQRKMVSIDLNKNADLFTIYINPQATTLDAVIVTLPNTLVFQLTFEE